MSKVLLYFIDNRFFYDYFFKLLEEEMEDKTLRINSIDAEVIESLDQEILSLSGNVVIKTDIVQLWSDKAIYDRENQTIELEGNIKALSKNLSIEAQNMEADFIDNEFYISSSSYNFMEEDLAKLNL